MRKKCKVSILAFTIIAVSIMLNSNFNTIYASSTNYDENKYGWLDAAIACKYPNATATKLAEVKAQALRQIAINEKKIADTNGAILKNPPLITRSSSCMSDYLYPECYNGGQIYNPRFLEGWIDSYYMRFYTPNMYQTANVVGKMSSSTSQGDVYVVAKLGPTGDGEDGDVLICWESNTSDIWGDGVFIGWTGYIDMPYNFPFNVYLYLWAGDPYFSFAYICVGTMTNPDMGFTYNDVMASSVLATGS